ncbi:conserved hypothetical protein [Candidatus Desulfosporosinus infrequens]|uniref:PIN domain-containing protein n=1 Tax=Candidatus Desulfosporosinus infrequens TaxID=2043169 RepID=A0A2U3LMT9_9FIRM|nr:conserved hypothetical protein [Candidatus Desulfosporosinus infrequens]
MKIMIDTNIYDQLYQDKEVAKRLIESIESGLLEFYCTEVQEEEIKENNKPEDRDKIEWSLQFHQKWALIIPTLFAFGVQGAGYGSSRWATAEEIDIYGKIRPNSDRKNHHKDRIIALAANEIEDIMFVTEDSSFRKSIEKTLPNLKALNWSEFIDYISNLLPST